MYPPPEEDNFNPEQQIKELKRNIESPDYFASLFNTACQKSKDIDAGIKPIVIKLIKTDSDVKESLIDEIKNVDARHGELMKEKRKTLWISIGLVLLGSVSAALVSAIHQIIQLFSK